MLYSVLAHRSKTATHAALPKRTATCRGVSPPLSVLLASARARSSLSTQIECSDTRIECPKEAQCSAVHPSCSGGVRRGSGGSGRGWGTYVADGRLEVGAGDDEQV